MPPTEKQLNYIAMLLGVRDNSFHSSAFAAIGEDMGCSSSKASRKATMKNASETIERLKKESLTR